MNKATANFFRRSAPEEKQQAPTNPNEVARMLQRRDRILKPEFEARRITLPTESNPIRVLPAVNDSRYSWMVPFETYKLDGQPEVVVPASIDSARMGTDPISTFRRFMYRNHRDIAYTREDRNTKHQKLELGTSKRGVVWFVHTAPDMLNPRPEIPLFLLVGSNADGANGGKVGFLHRFVQITEETDDDPSSSTYRKLLFGDITDPETGRNLIVRVTGQKQERNYTVNASVSPTPLDPIFTPIVTDHPEVAEILVPLEKTLYLPTDEELLKILEGYVRSRGHEKVLREYLGAPSIAASTMEREMAAAAQTRVTEPAAPAKKASAPAVEDEIPMDFPAKPAAAAVTPPAPAPAPVAPPAPAPQPTPAAQEPVTPPAPAPAPKAAPAPEPAATSTEEGAELYAGYNKDLEVLKKRLTQCRMAIRLSQPIPEEDSETKSAYSRVSRLYTSATFPAAHKQLFEDVTNVS